LAAGVVAGLLSATSAARADVLYGLGGVSFDDGGAASGVFDLNVANNPGAPQDVITTAGTVFGSSTYNGNPATSKPDGSTLEFFTTGYEIELVLVFADPLSGTTPEFNPLVLGGASYEVCSYDCVWGDVSVTSGTTRDIVSGYAQAPEPASLAMLGVALLGLGAARRRAR
jgi:hypothetical protein